MNPKLAKELYDKVEEIALTVKTIRGSMNETIEKHSLKLASEYGKDVSMISRTIKQIVKNGTYKENKQFYK